MSQFPRQSPHSPDDLKLSTLRRVRRLSHLLDNAFPIPGTSYRIGLDPLLGLLPGGGDFLGATLSAYIVLEGARLGLPRHILGQMVTNIIFETIAGSVPVLGDLVDATWKANAKNIAIMEEQLNVPRQSKQKTDWLFLTLLFAGLVLVVIVMASISIALLRWLLAAITS